MKNMWLRRGFALMLALALALPMAAWAEEAETGESEEIAVYAEAVEEIAELGDIDLYDPSIYTEEAGTDGLEVSEFEAVPEVTGIPGAEGVPGFEETAETEEIPEPSETTEATADPEPSETLEATAEPEASAIPEAVAEPEATAIPEATVEPEVTAAPEATAIPEVTVLAAAETVAAKAPVSAPKAMSFPKKSLKMGRGERVGMAVRTPDGAPVTGVKYVSSKPRVVEVDANGTLRARKKGSAKITATAGNGVKCTMKVKVLKAPRKVKLTKKSLEVCIGEAGKLKTKLPAKTASSITWTSSNPGVATVDAVGNVKGVAAGTAVITAATFNGKKAKCTVKVLNGRAPSRLTFDSNTIYMAPKTQLQLRPHLGEGETTRYTFTTDKKKVAAVNGSGLVTAKKKGTARIVVKTHNGLKYRLFIKVVKAPGSVKLSSNTLTLIAGHGASLKATLPSGTSSSITWKSANAAVASVDGAGNVKALGEGTTQITATTFNGKTAVCTVTVVTPTSEAARRQSNAQMAANIANDKSLGSKRTATAKVIEFMLNAGYEPAFVAGFCANAYNEGRFGLFESSKYVANYQKRPRYFCYLDGGDYYTLKDGKYVLTAVYLSPEEMKTYTGPAEARQRFGPEKYYWNKWSGKYIWEVNLDELYALLKQLSAGGWQGKFGVGITQWTGGRIANLIKFYRKYASPGATTVTPDQAAAAEMDMILYDLRGDYKKVYNTWKKENAGALDCVESARSAGSIVCLKYAIPVNKEQQAVTRGNRAAKFYKIMMGIS